MRCWPELAVVLLMGCGETGLLALPQDEDPPSNALETSPDWDVCEAGLDGVYANLTRADADAIDPDGGPPDSPALTFARRDASLDFGAGWWPVDEGWHEDPAWFAVRWTGWLRTDEDVVELQVAARDHAWLRFGGAWLAVEPEEDWSPITWSLPLGAGEHPVDVVYVHHAGPTSGLTLRPLGSGVRLCPSEWE
jgi:hypothetical protein